MTNERLIHNVVSYYMKKLPSWIDRDDILSAARVGVWQAGACHNESYLRRAASLRILDELRSQSWFGKRHGELVYDEPEAGFDDWHRDIVERLTLSDAVGALPVREREIVIEVYVRDGRVKDVAQRWGVTEQRAGQVLARGIERMRERMAA